MVITVAQDSPTHQRPAALASPSTHAIPARAISPRVVRDMPPVYTASHPIGRANNERRSSKILSHSRISITMNAYTHVVQDTQHEAKSHMDRLLRRRPGRKWLCSLVSAVDVKGPGP